MNEQCPPIFLKESSPQRVLQLSLSHNSFAVIHVFSQQSTQSPLAEVGNGRVRDTWGVSRFGQSQVKKAIWGLPVKDALTSEFPI